MQTIYTPTPIPANPFNSFWMAGYECTDQLNAFGNRVDLLEQTGHLKRLSEDYGLLNQFNIKTVREGIRWSHVEKRAYTYDWTDVDYMMRVARENGIQQVWDLCHFGFPDDLTPLHPMFARRFAKMARAFVMHYRDLYADGDLIITPINEVSFISWLGGDARGTSPYCRGQGWEVKYALMRAYIEGVLEMKEADPTVKIMSTEPLVNIVPQIAGDQEQVLAAAKINEDQYQAMDILTGRICGELGGKPDLLDIQGLNFYYNNQWINGTSNFLPWFNEENDPRWKPLSALLASAYRRYSKPVVLSETSHCAEHRPNWLEFITKECCKILDAGIPLYGVCLYPIIDRPDWDHQQLWHDAGLWSLKVIDGVGEDRELYLPYASELLLSQDIIRNKLDEGVPLISQVIHSDQQVVERRDVHFHYDM